MNYLAHAFLSGNNHDLLVGNFIADHVRGNHFENFNPAIVEGIYLHRRIDAFTDAHEKFKASKRCFYNGFEKYSGILIDIYFDYFLAKNFDNYSKVNLAEFSEHVYRVYKNSEPLMPQSSSRFLDYVIKNNIYTSYSSLSGIQTVLSHLSHRIQHKVQLERSIVLFSENEERLRKNFDIFFDDVYREFIRP